MSEATFSTTFAFLGMAVVFTIILVLTAAMLVTGYMFKTFLLPGTPTGECRYQPSPMSDPPAEHVAVIAAAIAIHRGAARGEISMLAQEDRGPWSVGSMVLQCHGHLNVLRRTR